MPYLYTDDGAPEACEYADNYHWFDQESLPALLASLQSPGEAARPEPGERNHNPGLFMSLAAAFAAARLRLRARGESIVSGSSCSWRPPSRPR